MLHGHGHEHQPEPEHGRHVSEAERERLFSTGAIFHGIVMSNEPSPADRLSSQVRVSVRFKDGEKVEFSEHLASLYQPEQGSAEAQRLAEVRAAEQLRHPDRVPKIQLPLSAGERVPVRYDASHRSKIVVDVPELRKRALHDYIEREQRPKQPKPEHAGTVTGPPWIVPTHCPNCGAPVDQATESKNADPKCEFCRQPLPVSPLR